MESSTKTVKVDQEGQAEDVQLKSDWNARKCYTETVQLNFYVYINNCSKVWVRFLRVSHAHQGYIYLIINTEKQLLLNITI